MLRVAAERRDGRDSLGIVIGGSGNGEQIAANKVIGVRAALVWSEQTAVLAREHNDANVVSVGGRMHSLDDMTRFVEVFLSTSFSGDERHVRRIAQIASYETTAPSANSSSSEVSRAAVLARIVAMPSSRVSTAVRSPSETVVSCLIRARSSRSRMATTWYAVRPLGRTLPRCAAASTP